MIKTFPKQGYSAVVFNATFYRNGKKLNAIEQADGKILAYCRSGTRSTLLWALARAAKGDHPAVLSEQAADAGYDLSSVAAMMDMLRGRAS